jgi:hypothetical protein
MTEINIIMPGSSQGRRELWHFPPVDDDPEGLGKFSVQFFDMATTRKEIDINKTGDKQFTITGREGDPEDPENLPISGDETTYYREGQIVIFTFEYPDPNNPGEVLEYENTTHVQGSSTYSSSENKTTVNLAEDIIPDNLPEGADTDFTKVEIWVDIDGWGSDQALTKVFTYEETINTYPNHSHCTDLDIEVWAAEDSKVPVDTISEEFGEDNENRWQRKPLLSIAPGEPLEPPLEQDAPDASSKYDWRGRWKVTDGFYNIFFELKDSNGETTYRGNANDLINTDYTTRDADEITDYQDTSLPAYDKDDIFGFVKKNNMIKKFDCAVTEIGTASIAHYLSFRREGEGEDLNEIYHEYCYDILTQQITKEGMNTNIITSLFFVPFDTSDRENFKLTLEPYYNSEEYEGKPISLGKEYEFYLAPRRWAYEARVREVTNEEGREEIVAVTGITNCSSDGSDMWVIDAEVEFYRPFERQHNWDGDTKYGMLATYRYGDFTANQDCWTLLHAPWLTTSPMYPNEIKDEIDCSGCSCTIATVPFEFRMQINCYGCLLGEYEWGCTYYFFGGGDCPDVFDVCSSRGCEVFTKTFTVTADLVVCHQYHRVGVWWDRFPSDIITFRDLTPGNISSNMPGTSPPVLWAAGFWMAGLYYNTALSLEGDALWEQAQNDFEDIWGLDSVPSGISAFHLFTTCQDSMLGFNYYSSYITPYTYNTLQGDTRIPLAYYSTSQGFTYIQSSNDNSIQQNAMQRVWEKIAGKEVSPISVIPTIDSSWFWENLGPSKYDEDNDWKMWNRWDNVPYGVGISPTKAEDLVGIIRQKKSEKVIFVWRKTDELFYNEITSPIANYAYEGHKVTFEGVESPDVNSSGHGGGEVIAPGSYFGDVFFPDQFVSSDLRRISHVGRQLESVDCGWFRACREDFAKCTDWVPKDEGIYELDVPIFVLGSRERALRDIANGTTLLVDQDYVDGWRAMRATLGSMADHPYSKLERNTDTYD